MEWEAGTQHQTGNKRKWRDLPQLQLTGREDRSTSGTVDRLVGKITRMDKFQVKGTAIRH